MRKLFSLGALFLAVSISASGQDYPKTELLGSYRTCTPASAGQD